MDLELINAPTPHDLTEPASLKQNTLTDFRKIRIFWTGRSDPPASVLPTLAAD
jgi:hypothetical protein